MMTWLSFYLSSLLDCNGHSMIVDAPFVNKQNIRFLIKVHIRCKQKFIWILHEYLNRTQALSFVKSIHVLVV